jgi:hypothetical protein
MGQAKLTLDDGDPLVVAAREAKRSGFTRLMA